MQYRNKNKRPELSDRLPNKARVPSNYEVDPSPKKVEKKTESKTKKR